MILHIDMNYYIYNEAVPLGKETCGTFGKHVRRNCTIRKVKNILKSYKYKEYSVYSFTNFYDNKTFKKINCKI